MRIFWKSWTSRSVELAAAATAVVAEVVFLFLAVTEDQSCLICHQETLKRQQMPFLMLPPIEPNLLNQIAAQVVLIMIILYGDQAPVKRLINFNAFFWRP